jgi:hypothetical protein
LELGATGDVHFTLFDKKTGDLIQYMSDNSNIGLAGRYLVRWGICSAKSLKQVIDGNHPDYTVDFSSNSKWSVFRDVDGLASPGQYDLSGNLSIVDAIANVSKNKDSIGQYLKNIAQKEAYAPFFIYR